MRECSGVRHSNLAIKWFQPLLLTTTHNSNTIPGLPAIFRIFPARNGGNETMEWLNNINIFRKNNHKVSLQEDYQLHVIDRHEIFKFCSSLPSLSLFGDAVRAYLNAEFGGVKIHGKYSH
jgi:hypothetical protein